MPPSRGPSDHVPQDHIETGPTQTFSTSGGRDRRTSVARPALARVALRLRVHARAHTHAHARTRARARTHANTHERTRALDSLETCRCRPPPRHRWRPLLEPNTITDHRALARLRCSRRHQPRRHRRPGHRRRRPRQRCRRRRRRPSAAVVAAAVVVVVDIIESASVSAAFDYPSLLALTWRVSGPRSLRGQVWMKHNRGG